MTGQKMDCRDNVTTGKARPIKSLLMARFFRCTIDHKLRLQFRFLDKIEDTSIFYCAAGKKFPSMGKNTPKRIWYKLQDLLVIVVYAESLPTSL